MTQYNLSRLAVSLNNTLTLPYLPPTSSAIRASKKLAIEAHDGPLKFPHNLRQAPLEQAKSWPLRRTTAKDNLHGFFSEAHA